MSGCFSAEVPVCPSDIVVDSDLEASPRADENLEQLAVAIDLRARGLNFVVATEATYARVVRDVRAARDLEPELEDVSFMPEYSGHTLMVGFSADAYARYERGEYHSWDCMNEAFEVDSIRPAIDNPNPGTVVLHFRKVLNSLAMLTEYGGRSRASGIPFTVAGDFDADGLESPQIDGPTICVQAKDTVWHYVYVDTDGQCAGECTHGVSYYFTTTPEGETTQRGKWIEGTDGPRPEFIELFRTESLCGDKAQRSSWF